MSVALVTGATGFIGRHLAQRLLDDGWTVHGLMRSSRKHLELPGLRSHQIDGRTESLIELLNEIRPDIVFHLASLFIVEHVSGDVRPLIESNVLFGSQLAEAMVRSGTLRLVNTGTAWQHFRGASYEPVNLYAATKQAFQDILVYYEETHGLKSVTLELFDTYGSGDERPKLVAALRRAAVQEVAFSPGRQLVDLVHIDDVVEAFMIAAQRMFSGGVRKSQTFVVSSGKTLPLKKIAAIYAKAQRVKLLIKWGGRPYRPREVMRPWSKGCALPGWTPRKDLLEGFRELSL